VPSGGDSDDRKSNWAGHVTAAEVLRTVLFRLEERGIEVVPVKGVVTARTLYDDIALRHAGDVDLRIRPSDFQLAVEVAQANGWSPKTGLPILWQTVFDVMGCEVDVETTLGPPGLCGISVATVLSRAAVDETLFGFAVRKIEFHDHVLVLVLNAFKDGFRSLPWSFEDLRRIVTAPEFEPDSLIMLAREGQVATVLWLVADWLAREHGFAEWSVVRDRIGTHPPSHRVARIHAWRRRLGSPPKIGLIATASSSDLLSRAAVGFGLAVAGVVRGRLQRAIAGIAKTVNARRH
jgi:hypothetical protein